MTDDKEQKGANCFLPFPFAWGLAVCVDSYKLVCRYERINRLPNLRHADI